MKLFRQKILLILLRGLVIAKRLFFVSTAFIGLGINKLSLFFRNTIGLWFYRKWFRWQRGFLSDALSMGGRALVLLGKRSVLQGLLFMVILVIMLPHTKFLTLDSVSAGRGTVLYSLIGPADDFGDIEEVVALTGPQPGSDVQNWRSGAISVDSFSGSDSGEGVNQVQDITAISVGGTAVTKPTILSGDSVVLLSENKPADTSSRTGIEYYEVQPGDVIGAIAEKYSISVVTILWANDLTTRSYIRPGDRLKILPVDGVVHKVKRGDTISKIAKLYDAEQTKIITTNKLQSGGADIVVGEDLLVPGGERPQAVRTYRPVTRVATTFNRVSAPPPSVSAPAGTGYLWPTTVRRITQYYGWRHTGLDIAGPVGTPIYASRAGTVIKSQCGWNGGYGCYIIIDHGGIQTLYAHNSQLLVSYGESVVQGQTIGLMGSTGRSTGPHIHYEVRVNGRRTNPLTYIR